MRILALTRYERLGSSSRVRFYQYFPYLKAQGVEIVNAPFFDDTYVQRLYTGRSANPLRILLAYATRLLTFLSAHKFDLVWLEKEIFPWLPAWFERDLQKGGIPYVVDYDDAVFHRYDMHRSRMVRALLGRKIDRVMQHAALVIAGNTYLADRARQAGAKQVEILPSVVDVGRYTMSKQMSSSPFRIGWIGSPVTTPYLTEIRAALEGLSGEAEIQVTLIGAGKSDPFPGIPTSVIPWDEDAERSLGEKFDVGIMPLVDGPFERGKCGYKLVQYMAGGLPVIASPVGVNSQIVEPGKNGYLAASSTDWLEAFRRLIRDEPLRQEMGRAGRQKAEQMYNLQVTAPILLGLLANPRKAEN